MSFTEKIDTLDLIINVLTEHEKKLDTLVARLEKIPATQGIDLPNILHQMEAQ